MQFSEKSRLSPRVGMVMSILCVALGGTVIGLAWASALWLAIGGALMTALGGFGVGSILAQDSHGSTGSR